MLSTIYQQSAYRALIVFGPESYVPCVETSIHDRFMAYGIGRILHIAYSLRYDRSAFPGDHMVRVAFASIVAAAPALSEVEEVAMFFARSLGQAAARGWLCSEAPDVLDDQNVANEEEPLGNPMIRDQAVEQLRRLMTKITVRPGENCVDLVVEGR